MWPWEHVAIGYIAYSLSARGRRQEPSAGATIAVVVGSLLPDLVDKPLAWWLGILPAGRSLAHSFLVAIPLTLLVYLVCTRYERSELGVAFGIGYLLHLPADAITPLLYGNPVHLDFLVWPIRPVSSPASVTWEWGEIVGFLAQPRGLSYLLGEVVLLGSAFVLWRKDGYPGLERWWRSSRTANEQPTDSIDASDGLSETGK